MEIPIDACWYPIACFGEYVKQGWTGAEQNGVSPLGKIPPKLLFLMGQICCKQKEVVPRNGLRESLWYYDIDTAKGFTTRNGLEEGL